MKNLVFVAIFLSITSCGTAKKSLYPKMYGEMPSSIVLLPIINKSTSSEAPLLYISTVAEPLANSGFYVFPIDITNDFFKREGITLGDQLKGISPSKYLEMFGTDSVLSVTIHKWDTNYYLVGGNVTVELECVITSTKTSNILWSQRNTYVVPTTSSTGNFLGDLIATAINTASVDYVPVARNLNFMTFNTIPHGKYHLRYLKDNEDFVQESK
jgi:hypothetical protein